MAMKRDGRRRRWRQRVFYWMGGCARWGVRLLAAAATTTTTTTTAAAEHRTCFALNEYICISVCILTHPSVSVCLGAAVSTRSAESERSCAGEDDAHRLLLLLLLLRRRRLAAMVKSRKGASDSNPEERLTRIAIVSSDRCKPKKCRQECKKSCPVVKIGKLCIEVRAVVVRMATPSHRIASHRIAPHRVASSASLCPSLAFPSSQVGPSSKIAWISQELCIGFGICVKKCPFEAIQIINLPKDLEKETTHRYSANSFKLHRLPVPRPGQVLGLVGTNGIGKSTALKILAGKQKPNLGRFESPPDWQVARAGKGGEKKKRNKERKPKPKCLRLDGNDDDACLPACLPASAMHRRS